ncbi:hypothetical protein QE109_11460 [Fusibacter bizertensis]|uniref:Centromere protein J C-terminal domain-containing protein n=1 Tax=Fusibacter bizertensis TaxID=1488331 RepID=A0ABT6NEC8_9FIRM|nr:hypothetical protein [Fusibacter bizertensis]MDH8678770.1 hypothetical protein [Fusibacter bizertensis]
MKISVDHVTNSSSESFGTVIVDSIAAIGLAIPFIAVTMGNSDLNKDSDNEETSGDEYDYEPYESTDPSDPSGTIIQKNRDGSVTKTHPDGTKGTKMPDDTVYVSAPDGTTGVIEPDGHQILTMPDGTKVEHYTDGTSYAEYPDGTSRVEYPDGTVKELNPQGEMIQVNPDGSFMVREPGKTTSKVYNPEGRFVGMSDERGTDIKVDENDEVKGTYVSPSGEKLEVTGNLNSGLVMQNDKGTKIEIDEDGGLVGAMVKDENGYLQIDENGAIKSEGKNPETGVTYTLDFNPDKGLKYKDSNGNFIDVDATGKGSARVVDDQGTLSIDKDGRVEATDKEGNYENYIPNDDGSATWESGDANGPKVTGVIDKEGNVEYTATDGSKLKITKDSTLTITDPSGNETSYTKAQIDNMVAEQKANVSAIDDAFKGGK